MNVPKNIKIAGVPYKVSIVPFIKSDADCVGEIAYVKQTIEIRDDAGKEQAEKVLAHEVLHGLYYALGWDQDEEDIQQLSGLLWQFIVDNPHMFNPIDKEEAT